MAELRDTIVELEQIQNTRDLVGRRLLNSHIQGGGGRTCAHGKDKEDKKLCACRPHQHRDESSRRCVGRCDPLELTELASPEGDGEYDADPCRFLDCWVKQRHAKFFPHVEGVARFSGRTLSVTGVETNADRKIEIPEGSEMIAKGSYGATYPGKVNGEEAVVKVNISYVAKPGDDVREAVLQTALGCAMRKSKAASGPSYAQIPRILALASINAEDTNEDGTTEFSSSNMIAMERLEGTLLNLLESLDTKQQQIHVLKEALRQVAKTLSYLSSRFDFEHLDLHAENVMYKKNGSKYQFYIIDFGLSRARINGVLFSSPVRGLARQTHPEGDIGMLVSYVFSRQLPVPPFLRGAMDVLVRRIEDNRTAYDRYIRGEIQRRKHKFEPMPFHQLHWNLYEQRRYLLDELQPFRPAAILAELAPKKKKSPPKKGGKKKSPAKKKGGKKK